MALTEKICRRIPDRPECHSGRHKRCTLPASAIVQDNYTGCNQVDECKNDIRKNWHGIP